MVADQEQIARLQNEIAKLLEVRPILGEDIVDQKIVELETQLQLLIKTEGGAFVAKDVNTGGGDFVGRDKITQYIYQGAYHGQAPRNNGDILKIYLGTIMDRCGMLPLQGLTDQTADAQNNKARLSLSSVYIDLDTKFPVSEQKLAKALTDGKISSFSEMAPDENVENKGNILLLTALNAAILCGRLVLLGDPGSGKTTFINFLSYCIATNRWEALPGWPEERHNILPILVTLRDFAYWLTSPQGKEIHETHPLWAYIVQDLNKRNLGFCNEYLEQAIENGQALLLLDGLDEVPPTEASRGQVLKLVQEFADRYKNSRYLVTCRVLSYDDPKWRLDERDFLALTLEPFNQNQIEGFIHAWHTEIAAKWNQPRFEIDMLEVKLIAELKRRIDLRRLAPNPLLLTVMTLVHTSDGRLPEARALLYERAVDILLWRWDQQRNKAHSEDARIVMQLREAGRDRGDLLVRLAKLAYNAHKQIHDGDDSEAVTGISQSELLNELRDLHPSRSLDWAESLVETMKLRAGLLIEQTGGVFTFPHRTFQEYLAGVHLARQPNFTSEALTCIKLGDFWRIVILLAVGHLVHSNIHNYELPRFLADQLCPLDANDNDGDWKRAWLAGEVLVELGVNRTQDSEHGRGVLARVRDRLVKLLEQGKLTPRERLDAADILGILGDPRFNAKELHLPAFLHGQPEPLLGFVKIPAGEFIMGSARHEMYANDDERPAYILTLPEFFIARYPVTNAQYRHFIDAGGYENEKYWTSTGWAWRNGENCDLSGIRDIALREKFQINQRSRTVENRNRPYWWNDPQRSAPTRPVVAICWYEALAYTCWLDEQLRVIHPELFLNDNVLRLPSEAEWERAARGIHGNLWAWGNDWSDGIANTYETKLEQASPVGMFPKGVTDTKLFDISGNVWEWTHTGLGDDLFDASYRYPYRSDDGRENESGLSIRINRGGSSYDFFGVARGSCRARIVADLFDNGLGFRCVIGNANFTSNIKTKWIDPVFDPIYRAIEQSAFPPQDKEDFKAEYQEIEVEVGKGQFADESWLARRLRNLKRYAPDIAEVALTSLSVPEATVAVIIKQVAERVKMETI